MGTFADTVKNSMLDSYFGSGTPATIYVAAYTAGGEASGGSYARVAVTNNGTNFPAASAGAKSNGAQINFPAATASWGTITEIRLFDAASAGNQLGTHTLASAKVVDGGDTLYIAAGDLDITLS